MRWLLLVALLLPRVAQAADVEIVKVEADSDVARESLRSLVGARLPELRGCLSVLDEVTKDDLHVGLTLRPDGTVDDARTFAVGTALARECVHHVLRGARLKTNQDDTVGFSLKVRATPAERAILREQLRGELRAFCGRLETATGDAATAVRTASAPALASATTSFRARAAMKDAERRLREPPPTTRDMDAPTRPITKLFEEADRVESCPRLAEIGVQLLAPQPALASAALATALAPIEARLEECRALVATAVDDRVVIRIASTNEGKVVESIVVSPSVENDCVQKLLRDARLPPTSSDFFAAKGSRDDAYAIDRVRTSALPAISWTTLRHRVPDAEVAATRAAIEALCAVVGTDALTPRAAAAAKDARAPAGVRRMAETLEMALPEDATTVFLEMARDAGAPCRSAPR